MKIFLTGIYAGGGARPGSRSIHLRVTEKVRYPHLLESFHYADDRMARMIRHNGQKIFLDSGAFSSHAQGVRISPRQYARFIREHQDIIEIAANLDVIGQGNEQRSYDNLKTMQKLLQHDGLSHLIQPVHHVRDDLYWLEKYIDEGHDFICLGGMVTESTSILRRWLDHVWGKFLTNPDGTPIVKVHGFGLTTRELMFRYPFHSVNSTTWISSRFGGGVLMDFAFDDGTIGDFTISFSDRSSKRFKPNSWHYCALPPDDQEKVDRRLEQLEAERIKDSEIEAAFRAEFGIEMGFNPTAFGKSYGLQWLANIAYFERACGRGVDRFVRERRVLP